MSEPTYDLVVIGAGIIGLSAAMELKHRYPALRLLVLEKSINLGTQQSGHNSGVIHSGIYYKPGSFKSRFCVEGRRTMAQFCDEHAIPTWRCGKLIIANSDAEMIRLEALRERGVANQVEGLEIVGPERIAEIEPHVRAKKALWAPNTGIVDFRKVTQAFAEIFQAAGGELRVRSAFIRAVDRSGYTVLETETGEVATRYVVNCAGLHCDRVARRMGIDPHLQIIPFRGEYFTLRKDREYLVKGLIYPEPDPAFPFLGVHLTQTMKGWVEAGPNAVLATQREGYSRWDFSARDFSEIIRYAGFWKMFARDWRTGLWEINRSIRKSVFLKSLQALVPALEASDLAGAGSGVRAQAVDPAGNLLDDFRIQQTDRAIHVLNAPSPGATSSLVIGRHIAEMAGKNFQLS